MCSPEKKASHKLRLNRRVVIFTTLIIMQKKTTGLSLCVKIKLSLLQIGHARHREESDDPKVECFAACAWLLAALLERL